MPSSSSSSSLSSLLQQASAYWQTHVLQSSSTKKWATAFAVLFAIMWMYKRVELARANERRRGAQLRDARGNLLPANIALNQHAPSPLPQPHNDADDVRNLAPAERYLSERGSRGRRQSVCLTLNPTNGVVFELGSGTAASSSTGSSSALRVQDGVVPLLVSLSQYTLLYCIVLEPDTTRHASVLSALESAGAFESGLKRHRVLFCSTAKGKSAIVRHVEPNLCIDDDRAMLSGLKPHLDQVVCVQTEAGAKAAAQAPAAASSSASAAVATFTSLSAFFASQHKS